MKIKIYRYDFSMSPHGWIDKTSWNNLIQFLEGNISWPDTTIKYSRYSNFQRLLKPLSRELVDIPNLIQINLRQNDRVV